MECGLTLLGKFNWAAIMRLACSERRVLLSFNYLMFIGGIVKVDEAGP